MSAELLHEASWSRSARGPSSIVDPLLTGLLRYMRSKNPACLNFLDTNQLEFVSLHNAMDNVFRQLRVQGASV